MAARRTKSLIVMAGAAILIVAAVIVGVIVVSQSKRRDATSSAGAGATNRPAADTPRGVMWDAWHAAMNGDRETLRAAFHATTETDRAAADALAELLIAEAAFARQLRHTWPMSPISRDGAGTWFLDVGDAALLTARQNIDAAAINATVQMPTGPAKLTRTGGAWKIDTAELVRARLELGREADLAAAAKQLAAMTDAYRDLTCEVAALRVASPSDAMEKLRQHVPGDAGKR